MDCGKGAEQTQTQIQGEGELRGCPIAVTSGRLHQTLVWQRLLQPHRLGESNFLDIYWCLGTHHWPMAQIQLRLANRL